ncbi:MAG: cation-transporting P-type ATPase [Candidatus Aenigmatarchaeota archaeon]
MYDLPIEEVFNILNTSPDGLTDEEAKERLKKYGPNEIKEKKESNLVLFLKQFKNPLVIIILLAGIVAIFVGKYHESIIVFALLIFNAILGFYHEIKTKITIESLKKLTKIKARVIRNGIEKEIDTSEIVPGDIIVIKEGDIVPADARLIESVSLQINEAILTGESYPVEKDADIILPTNAPIYERKNCIFKGTSVFRGKGKAVVYATGRNTEIGKISEILFQKAPESPLIKAFDNFAKYWVPLNIILLVIVFLIGILIYQREISKMFLYVLSQLISAIPSGLPIVITLSLAIGARRLASRKFLVKYLPSVETLGSIEYLIVDKTGTITTGNLKVDKYYTIDEEKLIECSILCNESDGTSGDILDLVLLKWVESKGVDWKKIRKEYEKVWEHPFDPNKRFSATIVKKGFNHILYIKGAYETLKKMSYGINPDLDKLHDELTSKGLRVLAFGYNVVDKIPADIEKVKIRIIGLIGFIDPPKENIEEVIKIAKNAKIKIIMVTGDNILTAKYIAKKVGIYSEGDMAIEGKEIENIDEKSLYEILKKTTVVARALPEHKYKIVKVLRDNGHIVGVLGDGVNDAPALRISDIGLAVENSTQVAKDASKAIILSKDLSVIINGILEGRKISRNISGVIRYLLSTNLFEVMYNSLAIITGLPLPIYPLHPIWINLVTDGVQDKAYPFTKHDAEILDRPPKNPKEMFFGKKQIFLIFLTALFLSITHYFLYRHLLTIYPYELVITISFTSMVFSQWPIGIQEISDEPFFKNPVRYFKRNPYIFLGIFIGLLLQLLVIYFGGKFFHTVPLSLEHFKYTIIIPIITFFFLEIRKIVLNILLKKD